MHLPDPNDADPVGNASGRPTLSRRDFVASASAIALAPLAARADSPVDSPRLTPHIHPHVQMDRVELAREDNAFWDWKEATEKLTSLYEFSAAYSQKDDGETKDDASGFDLYDTVRNAERPLASFPSGDAGRCVRAWLDAVRESIKLVEQGIAKGHYQVPQQHLQAFLDDADSTDDLSIPRRVARLMTVAFNDRLHHGELAGATSALANLLKLSQMAVMGEGYLIHYLAAMAAHALASDAVSAFALHPASSPDALCEIRDLLKETQPTPEALARVFRVEVVYFTQHEVARLPQANDLPRFVEALVQQHLLLNDGNQDIIASDQEQAVRVRDGLLKLLDGHPQPFDPADTVRLYSGVVAEMIRDLSTPWLKRKKSLADTWLKEIEPWPQPLWFISDLSFMLFTDGQKQERNVTDAELEQSRRALRSVKNPVGKLMLYYLESFAAVRRAYHLGRLRTDVGLALIACRLFRDQRQRLPRDLSELVETRLLESVPRDPFSGSPLRYDAQRQIIWSFGLDEKDDGGNWDFDAEFPDGDDLVWRLPLV